MHSGLFRKICILLPCYYCAHYDWTNATAPSITITALKSIFYNMFVGTNWVQEAVIKTTTWLTINALRYLKQMDLLTELRQSCKAPAQNFNYTIRRYYVYPKQETKTVLTPTRMYTNMRTWCVHFTWPPWYL